MSKSCCFCTICGRVVKEDGVAKVGDAAPVTLTFVCRVSELPDMYLTGAVCKECGDAVYGASEDVADLMNQRRDVNRPVIEVR